MLLQRLSVDGLRNLSEIQLEPHPRLTVFAGPNGQGKTNLLEAVHLVAALRPLKALERASDLVGFERERGVLHADFDLDGPLPVEIIVEPRGRKATLAGKQVRDIGQVAARIGVVAFTPDDLGLVRGAPQVRRRALDRFCYGLSTSFADVSRRYEAALSQRNKLLKAWPIDPHLLSAYSAPLVDAGVALMQARLRAVEAWRPVFRELVAAITQGALHADLAYSSALLCDDNADPVTLQERFHTRLAEQQESEQQRKTTLSGPHLDDLVITLGERRARRLASQGEARALVLALKLASVRVFTQERQTAPLLLLDDVAGELDAHRARCLFEVVDGVGAQTFVTTPDPAALKEPGAGRVFALAGGRVQGERALC